MQNEQIREQNLTFLFTNLLTIKDEIVFLEVELSLMRRKHLKPSTSRSQNVLERTYSHKWSWSAVLTRAYDLYADFGR